MNERYTKLFSLPNDLYLDGSPLLIAAGALLKDNKSGKVLVQLKLRNLYHAPLIACKVHVRAFDPSGEEVKGVKNFSYLDLQISCGADFGTKTPIFLPDNTTRRVSICVIQAVFEDGTVWQQPVNEWTQPPLRWQRLEDRFPDHEMQAQYSIEIGGNCEYLPEITGSLSLCTCGAINLASEKVCSTCHREIGALIAALDDSVLESKKKERLAKEEAERIEKERREEENQRESARIAEEKRKEQEQRAEEARIAAVAAKRRMKKIAVIASITAILVIVVGVFVKRVIIPENQYKAAEELLAAGDYDEAIEAFDALGDYKDANDRKEEADNQRVYVQAKESLAAGDYENAIPYLKELGDYRDSAELLIELYEIYYKKGVELLSGGVYDYF